MPTNLDSAGNLEVDDTAATTNGAIPFLLRNVTTAQAIKTTPGELYDLTINNFSGATAWIQIFNQAAPVLGTTLPVLEFEVPASTDFAFPISAVGIAFSTAIYIASTTAEYGSTVSAAGVTVTGSKC